MQQNKYDPLMASLEGKPIVLIGMMGSGKSTIGKKLAQTLNLDFIDTDKELEKSSQMTIAQIFTKFGEATFRDGERHYISRILTEGTKIISTGGGAFIDEQTREHILTKSICIWLNVPLPILINRVRRRTHRPLLQGSNIENTMQSLLEKREPIYKLAHIQIDVGQMNSQKTTEKICFLLEKMLIKGAC